MGPGFSAEMGIHQVAAIFASSQEIELYLNREPLFLAEPLSLAGESWVSTTSLPSRTFAGGERKVQAE